MEDTGVKLDYNIKSMPDVVDLIKNLDTDAMKWALAFKKVIIENDFTIDAMKDENYMVGWFACALQTQHDQVHSTNKKGRKSNRGKLEEILRANGYELVKNYVDDQTNDEDFRMDSWVHKKTNAWVCADFNLDTDMKFLLKYKIDKHIGHGIGFSTATQEWYGWTHRALFGFSVGSTCKKGDAHYRVANETEFIEELKNDTFELSAHDVLVHKEGNIVVKESTFTGYEDTKPNNPELGKVTISKYRLEDEGYTIITEMVECGDPECLWKGELVEPLSPEVENHKCKYVPAEPDYYYVPYGKGEWTAKTLEDAKQMAVDFMKGVS